MVRPRLARVVTLALLFGPWSLPRADAQEEQTRGELWPEVDAYVRLNSSMKLFGLAAFSAARGEDYSEGQYGIHWDVSWKRRFKPLAFSRLTERTADEKLRPLMFRVGYRYNGTIEDNGDPLREHRGILETHARWLFPGRVLASDRNRLDLRWIDGVYSWRYRNRLMLEREVSVGSYRFTPYASVELYYDSRFDAWNRNRYAVGLQTPLHPHLMLDTYYMRQDDRRSQPAHVNALGLALNVFF